MLQQILQEMWVDPVILAELDETQKQTLFCKMREEQVRRWRVWDQKVSEQNEPKFQKSNGVKKNVQFMTGEDGEPWVWVMGEHSEDKSIETILSEESKLKALEQARKEAQQLRKSVEKELTQLIDYKPLDSLEQKFDLSPKTVDSLEDTFDIYCTVDELRLLDDKDISMSGSEMVNIGEKGVGYRNERNIKIDMNKNALNFNFIEGKKDVLHELCGGSGAVGSRVAAWERRVAAARATDILRTMRLRRARRLRDADERADHDDSVWREQERKAKEAEAAMRQIARVAREEHRRSVVDHVTDTPLSDAKPPSRDAVVEWFTSKELKRGAGLDEENRPAEWFHGLITRSEAERLLSTRGEGSFVVRVSERVWGYAVSYRARQRCKHFLVEAGDQYRLLGAAHTAHQSLADLVDYHKKVPITESGGELLTTPCPAEVAPAILNNAILETSTA